ncbi:hypothetical protein BDV28DRAFT_140600 [Aspergillus coremiiformis]|uniref:SGNH hydrolase-type esterase domain-containing protein n=1 Tax=Aspergillus coremiiformis TaxID=138285 RepID=A0A5N6YYJ8_9EURO|nr:hypothetical protein BDV28DRAFT_140600 [Aspergillus coremiiformis]
MRLFNKFHTVCALAVASILLSAWFLASQHYYKRVAPTNGEESGFDVATSFDRRLVVFGDSWSDNNTDELQGSVWTEWLCSMFQCHHENMAQTAKSLRGKYIGSVVDNDELPASLLNLNKSPLADFKDQVSQWTAAEARAVQEDLASNEETISYRQNRTIITVAFGVWDVWNLLDKAYDAATQSVDRSIGVIIDQLNVLSQSLGTNELKVILTLAPDVTFFPAFRPTRNQHIGRHKDAVRITEDWNSRLREAAEKWDQGTIYLFDTNAFLADLIRDWQLFAAGIEEPNGLGKNQEPGWENVDDACVENEQQLVMTSEVKKCDNPEKFLFWNEMHLGPSAHRLMGTEIFHGIEEMWLR